MTKHFFKTLIIFTGMILLGLLGIFLVSYLDKQSDIEENGIDNIGRLQIEKSVI